MCVCVRVCVCACVCVRAPRAPLRLRVPAAHTVRVGTARRVPGKRPSFEELTDLLRALLEQPSLDRARARGGGGGGGGGAAAAARV